MKNLIVLFLLTTLCAQLNSIYAQTPTINITIPRTPPTDSILMALKGVEAQAVLSKYGEVFIPLTCYRCDIQIKMPGCVYNIDPKSLKKTDFFTVEYFEYGELRSKRLPIDTLGKTDLLEQIYHTRFGVQIDSNVYKKLYWAAYNYGERPTSGSRQFNTGMYLNGSAVTVIWSYSDGGEITILNYVPIGKDRFGNTGSMDYFVKLSGSTLKFNTWNSITTKTDNYFNPHGVSKCSSSQ